MAQPKRQLRDSRASKAQSSSSAAETSRPLRSRKAKEVIPVAGSDEEDDVDAADGKSSAKRKGSELLFEAKDKKDEAWYDVEIVKIANKTVKVQSTITRATCSWRMNDAKLSVILWSSSTLLRDQRSRWQEL